MKKTWKLILIALLAALLVCTCMSAIAEEEEECTHVDASGNSLFTVDLSVDGDETYTPLADHVGHVKTDYEILACSKCGAIKKSTVETRSNHAPLSSFWVKDVGHTCTEDGYSVYECKTCGDTWTVKSTVDTAPGHKRPTDESKVETVEGEKVGCLQKMYEIFDCEVCGTKGVKVETTRKLHEYEHLYVPATCKAAGYEKDVCIYCKDENNVVVYPQLDHLDNWDECIVGSWAPIVNATCTEDGKQAYTCKWCDQLIYDIIPKTGHRLEQDPAFITKKPTCTEEGTGRAVCTNPLCDYYEDGWRIPALGHNIVAHDPKIYDVSDPECGAPTCTRDGTATYYESCSRCGLITYGTFTPIPALGHKYEGKTEVVVPPSCTSYGLVRVWCQRCSDPNAHVDKQVPMVDHVHSNADDAWSVTAPGAYPATCMNTGIAVNVCVNCGGDPQTKVLDKVEHSYYSVDAAKAEGEGTGYKTKKDPTCTAAGSIEVYCKYGCQSTKTETIKALGHSWDAKTAVYKPASKLPTCTEPVTLTHTCTTCKTTETIVVTPALGHLYGTKNKDDRAPTCTEPGIRYGTCQREGCTDDKGYEIIPALGHKAGEATVTKAATCTEKGVKTTKCTTCGTVLKTEEIAAVGHKAGEATVTKAATCTEKGEKTTKCTVCGTVIKTEEIAAVGHKAGEAAVTKAATCTEDGEKAVKCTVCGVVISSEKIAATGHVPGKEKIQNNVGKTYCTVCGELISERKISSGSSSSSGSSAGTSTVAAPVIYSGSINAAGVAASELGGTGSAMVTPVDLSVDGTYTYNLVAGDKYVVGAITVTVSGGKFTVTYAVVPGVVITTEGLSIYANVEALKAGTATVAAFNTEIDAAGDTKVILAINLVGTFDVSVAGAYTADAAQVATMKGIVD